MKKSLRFVLAVVVAGGASLASAQIRSFGGDLSSSAGFGSSSPLGLNSYGGGLAGAAGLGTTGPLSSSPNPSAVSSMPSFDAATSPSLGSYRNGMGLGYAAPSPLRPGAVGAMPELSPTTHYPLVNCYAGACFGTDGTQYARGAGNVLFGSNGKVCQTTAPGAPLVCN